MPARWAALCGATIALCTGLAIAWFTPLYTDEIGWRFQLSRAPFDGGVDRFIVEGCRSLAIEAPFWMQPLRLASAWGNALLPDPFWVRVHGLTLALTAVTLLLLLIRRIAPRGARSSFVALGFSALALGLLPLLLIWSRPEQPLLVLIVASLLIGLAAPAVPRRWHALAGGGAVLIFGAVALAYHLKALVYLPVFLLSIATTAPGAGQRIARLIMGALLIAAAASAVTYWSARFQCPGDPIVANTIAGENLGSVLTREGTSIWTTLGEAMKSIGPFDYIDVVVPDPESMSQWVPPPDIRPAALTSWRVLVWSGWVLLLGTGSVAACIAAWRGWRERRTRIFILHAGALAIGLIGWSFAQLNVNTYEAALWLPLAVAACLLALAAAGERGARAARLTAPPLAIAALLSAGLLFADQDDRLKALAGHWGFAPGHRYLLMPFGYSAEDVRAAGRQCGFVPGRSPRLVVDDLTYFTYMRDWRPIYAAGTLTVWRGAIADPARFLAAQGSPGGVVACQSLPDDWRVPTRRTGDLCCFRLPHGAE